jgi:hypothetical protein
MGYSDLPGGGVMSDTNDKAEAEEKKPEPELTKSREYRRFKKLLRKVVKAPPMKRSTR